MSEAKKDRDNELVRRNSIAIGETLEHHGKLMDELQDMVVNLRLRITMLEQEQILQKQMIVKSLTQKFKHGPTT